MASVAPTMREGSEEVTCTGLSMVPNGCAAGARAPRRQGLRVHPRDASLSGGERPNPDAARGTAKLSHLPRPPRNGSRNRLEQFGSHPPHRNPLM